jgi:hypothetical protein
MPNPDQTTELKKPQQYEKDARVNPHRPEYYVPRGVLKLASLIEWMGKQA